MSSRKTENKDDPHNVRGRDPKTGEFRPAEDARKKRRTAADDAERELPANGKLGRAHDD